MEAVNAQLQAYISSPDFLKTPAALLVRVNAGKLDVAFRNIRAMVDEKRRTGRDLPYLNWRYILFKWNDGDAMSND